jgi:hypothetical protein
MRRFVLLAALAASCFIPDSAAWSQSSRAPFRKTSTSSSRYAFAHSGRATPVRYTGTNNMHAIHYDRGAASCGDCCGSGHGGHSPFMLWNNYCDCDACCEWDRGYGHGWHGYRRHGDAGHCRDSSCGCGDGCGGCGDCSTCCGPGPVAVLFHGVCDVLDCILPCHSCGAACGRVYDGCCEPDCCDTGCGTGDCGGVNETWLPQEISPTPESLDNPFKDDPDEPPAAPRDARRTAKPVRSTVYFQRPGNSVSILRTGYADASRQFDSGSRNRIAVRRPALSRSRQPRSYVAPTEARLEETQLMTKVAVEPLLEPAEEPRQVSHIAPAADTDAPARAADADEADADHAPSSSQSPLRRSTNPLRNRRATP